jgi:NADPH:quinone reductase
MATTETMNAAILDGANKPFRVASVARPWPGQGQVLVRIKASGLNPLDTKIHAGHACAPSAAEHSRDQPRRRRGSPR